MQKNNKIIHKAFLKKNNNKNQEKINRKQKIRTNKKVQQVYYRHK